MKLIELHILQSFPVSCLNRDDVGAPKTAYFGGVNRARISSQCLKRAIRESAKRLSPGDFTGVRTRLVIGMLIQGLMARGIGDEKAREVALKIGGHLAKNDEAAAKKEQLKVKTLLFLSPSEINSIAKAIAEALMNKSSDKDLEKVASKACKSVGLKDAADIAVFGRMVASDPSLELEGAACFNHALSTHRADNDIDFFAAVDEMQPREESGAGMTGTLEFTSATYYRYVGLNLDMLADKDHMGCDGSTMLHRQSVVDTFLRAAILAVPGARMNSMNASTLPGYVLGLFKQQGQPLQLINAFENPVVSRNGLMDESIARLKAHHEQMKSTWGIQCEEFAIPDMNLEAFTRGITAHVH